MLIKYRILSLMCIAVLCVPMACKTRQDNQQLLLDPSVRVGKLPNGFTYYIRKNKTPEKRVVMYLAIKAGSILETDEQRGIAHFVEHMNFNGTKHFPKKQLTNYLEKSGIRFGADINANTGYDETVYQLPLPSDNPELLAGGLQIMRDWAQDANMEAADVDRERHVILEEKRVREGLSQRYWEKLIPFYTNDSRYSRLPIGTEEVLLKVSAEEIRSFHKDWYRPNLQALLIVGDIDVDAMEKQIKSKFSDLKNPEKEKERTVYHSTLTGKSRYMQFTDPEQGGISVDIFMKQFADTVTTTAGYQANLMKNILAQLVSNRFRGLPYASFTPLTGGLTAFSVGIGSKPGETENNFKSIWLEVRRMQEQGFTQTELDRVKKNYLQRMNDAFKEKDKIASDVLIQSYLQHFLTGEISLGIDEDYKRVNEQLPEISLKEINSLMQASLKDTDRDIIVKSSEHNKAFLPSEATVLAWLESVYAQKLAPFKDEVQDIPLLKNKPKPGKITGTEALKVVGIQKLTLSNGIKVLLKKTDFQNDQVLISGFAEGGASLYADDDYQNALNASQIILAAGVGNYNRQQLERLFTGKHAQLRPFIDDTHQGFNGSSAQEDLPAVLELVYAYFTEPRKDPGAYHTFMTRAKEEMGIKGESPGQAFMDTVNRVLNNYSPRKLPLDAGQLGRINLDRVYEIYKERFADASGFTFVLVGNIDEAKVKPLLEKYLGALPAKNLKETSRDRGIQIPSGQIAKTVYKGTAQKSTVLLTYSGDFNYTIENTTQMMAITDILKIRLTQRLRDQESGTYTPNVRSVLSKYPTGRFGLQISFDCVPQNVEKLIASTKEELDKIRTSGPSVENLQKFKISRQVMLRNGTTNNDFLLEYLVTQLKNKESLTQLYESDVVLNKITVKSIQETAAKFIQNKNYIKLVLMPEKTKH